SAYVDRRIGIVGCRLRQGNGLLLHTGSNGDGSNGDQSRDGSVTADAMRPRRAPGCRVVGFGPRPPAMLRDQVQRQRSSLPFVVP
ncbi:hypothetical protein, partial [Rhodoplanes roseus]|uniref:hypothetical protein n=1 Tax=Rhodoplanes roseus TaxID=29409 RepID=UPI001AECCA12